MMPNGDLTEPWLFLIGTDGTIVDRWSSMWSEREVETELEALPPMKV
jgi:glutathione peroxidase-family protein